MVTMLRPLLAMSINISPFMVTGSRSYKHPWACKNIQKRTKRVVTALLALPPPFRLPDAFAGTNADCYLNVEAKEHGAVVFASSSCLAQAPSPCPRRAPSWAAGG